MPPDRKWGAPTPEGANHHQHQSQSKGQYQQDSPAPRRLGSYAQAWRQGFGRGFQDALRIAARRTDDPQVWTLLSQLADEFSLAGSDDRA